MVPKRGDSISRGNSISFSNRRRFSPVPLNFFEKIFYQMKIEDLASHVLKNQPNTKTLSIKKIDFKKSYNENVAFTKTAAAAADISFSKNELFSLANTYTFH